MWVMVWSIITLIPFLTWKYFGFVWIILPFSGFILIKLIIGIIRGDYN